MPGPSPAEYDSEQAWMHECVPFYVNEGRPQDQAVAICMTQWTEAKSEVPAFRKLIEEAKLRSDIGEAKTDEPCHHCTESSGTKYSEDQPRDDHGRFGSGGGDTPKSPGPLSDIPQGLQPGSGSGKTKDDPIKTTDVHTAAVALRDGKYVELNQPHGTSTLLDEVQRMVNDAVAKGADAKVEGAKYDLCKASIPGSNLNCDAAVVESRTGMPQLVGKPTPGSPADALPKNDKGEVDLSAGFVQHLEGLGIAVRDTQTPAENLRASQRELNGGKVAGMMNALLGGNRDIAEGQIFTTRDDYVVDGHHRWAATVGAEYKAGEKLTMNTRQIDLGIVDTIRLANEYVDKQGIPRAAKSARSAALDDGAGTVSTKEARSPRPGAPDGESTMSQKRAVYEITEFKSFDGADGAPTGDFKAVVSVFGNVDLQGDRVMPGAFKAWLAQAKRSGDPIPVVWSHQWDNPLAHIGWVDPAKAAETPEGFLVDGHIDIETNPFAKQVHTLMAERRVTGWSFAYDVVNEKRAKDGANELLELRIIEVGPTLKGANPEAQLVSAKNLGLDEAMERAKAGRRLSAATMTEMSALRDELGKLTERMAKLMGDVGAEEDGEPVAKSDDVVVDDAVVDTKSEDGDGEKTDSLQEAIADAVKYDSVQEALDASRAQSIGDFLTEINDLRHGSAVEADPLAMFIGERVDSEALTLKAAIAPHKTDTATGGWDGAANEKNVTSPDTDGKSYFARIYAWVDDNGDPDVKASYKFIHHDVAGDGTPGAANLAACSAGIAVLNGGRGGTTIPAGDVKGVYEHLAAHLRDAGQEPPSLKHIEAEATKSETSDEDREPAAKSEFSVFDPESLDLRLRIEEMRRT